MTMINLNDMNDKLKVKLDELTSIYVRLRDADDNGYVTCISCGRKIFWKDADNGHYIPRANLATRFDLHNCNGQCRECNRKMGGNLAKYREGLIKKYSVVEVVTLEELKNRTIKFMSSDYENMINVLKKGIQRLKKIKGL